MPSIDTCPDTFQIWVNIVIVPLHLRKLKNIEANCWQKC